MKPVFGIDITENKNNDSMHAEKFIGARVSPEYREALSSSSEQAEETLKKAKLPVLLGILRLIGLLCGGYGILTFLNDMSEIGFKNAFERTPLVFFIGIIGIAAFIMISILGAARERRILEGSDAAALAENIQDIAAKIYSELGVPNNAKNVDVLLFKYKLQGGEITPKADALSLTPYINFECKAFVNNNALSLADLEQRYDFPIAQMRAIHKVDKRISVPTWNKPHHHASEEYKVFKLKKDNMDCIHFKPYYILELIADGESYGIYFPSYEIDSLRALTGLEIAENEYM